MPYGKINERQIDAVNQSTDFLDYTVQLTLQTSGGTSGTNVCLQGQPVITDATSLVTNNVTTPAIEQCVMPANATSGGALVGIYQGATFTNASTTATLTKTINVRQRGYGVVLAGGVTTSVTVGGVISILPGSTPNYASQLVATWAVTAQAMVYHVGSVVATGAKTTIGAVVISASTTTQGLVNAYINIPG